MSHTIVYAWGSAEDENLELAVQTISGMHSAPSGVPGGTGGQAAGNSEVFASTGWAILAGSLLAAVLAALLMSRTRPRPARSRNR